MLPVSSNDLCEKFDAFMVDLWGTIHDGEEPLNGAIDFLSSVVKLSKPLIFATNSPSSSEKVESMIGDMGILKDTHYHKVITAGEVALNLISKGPLKGKNCFTWGKIHEREEKDWIIERGMINLVDSIDDADFILKHRIGEPHTSEEKINEEMRNADDYLKKAHSMDIPIVCANPDRRVMYKNKEFFIEAGEISHQYQKMRGKVFWCGKPDNIIYNLFLEEARKLGFKGDNKRVACIGDNLETDIPGSINANMSSFFFVNGIHKRQLEDKLSEGKDYNESLQSLLSEYCCDDGVDGFLNGWD